MRVLAYDDDPEVLKALGRAFGRYRINLTVYPYPTIQSVQDVARAQPEVVITDLNMPNMTGAEFARALRQDRRTANIPVYIYSTMSVPYVQQAAAGISNVAVFCKQERTPEDLATTIQVMEREDRWSP